MSFKCFIDNSSIALWLWVLIFYNKYNKLLLVTLTNNPLTVALITKDQDNKEQ